MDQWVSEQILSLHTSHYYDPECSYFGIIWSACVYYPISFFIGMAEGGACFNCQEMYNLSKGTRTDVILWVWATKSLELQIVGGSYPGVALF